MLRIVCDPSSGNIELYLIEIIPSGSLMFVVCVVGVWQRNFETVVCVYGKGILRLPHRWQRVVHNAGDYIEGQQNFETCIYFVSVVNK